MARWIKYITLVTLLVSVFILGQIPSWGALITFLVSLIGFLTSTFFDFRKVQLQRATHVPDAILFKRFLELLPSNSGAIRILRDEQMSTPKRMEWCSNLEEFRLEWTTPEHEFHDKELEDAKKALHQLVDHFLSFWVINCMSLKNSDTLVISRWDEGTETGRERIRGVLTKLDRMADEIVRSHEALVRLGRKKLNV